MFRIAPIALALLLIGWLVWDVGEDGPASPPSGSDGPAPMAEAGLRGRAARRATVVTTPTTPETAAKTQTNGANENRAPRRIQVRVVRGTLDGPPLEGIPIHRGETTRPLSGRSAEVPLGFTDFEGSVMVEVPAGMEIVHARGGPDYLDWAIGWVARDPKGPTIVLRPARLLEGRVLGVPREKLRGIYVQARWENPAEVGDIQRTNTNSWSRPDGDGRFTVKIPRDATAVQLFAMAAAAWRPEAHGLKTYAGTFVPEASEGPFALDFRGAVAISGELVGDDDTKVTHATVSLRPIDRPWLMGGDAALRGERNQFEISGLAPGRYLLTAHPIQDGWAAAAPRVVTLPLKRPVTVVLPPATTLSGRVEGIASPAGVHVEWWRRPDAEGDYAIQARTPLSAQGTFALSGIADGDTLLRVVRSGKVLTDIKHVRVPAVDVVLLVRKDAGGR